MIRFTNQVALCFLFVSACVGMAGGGSDEKNEEAEVGAVVCEADCECEMCQEQEYESFCAMVKMFGNAIVTDAPTPEQMAAVVLMQVAMEGSDVLSEWGLDAVDLSVDAIEIIRFMRECGIRGDSMFGRRGVASGAQRSKFQKSYR